MESIKLTLTDGRGTVIEHTHRESPVAWPDLMQLFRQFLNGAGFSVPHGEFVSAEADEEVQETIQALRDEIADKEDEIEELKAQLAALKG